MKKRLIINSDDFGISKALNDAVLNGYLDGVLTQASLMANCEYFEDALARVIPKCRQLAVGVHLNTYEGKSLTNCPALTNEEGYFNKSFIQTLLKSCDKEFLSQIETEWDAQIQKVISAGIKPSHLDSHVHYHAIPNLFKIAKKLADKYGIENIRTQRENFYITKINSTYIINIIKNVLLNFFSVINKNKLSLNTNGHLIGVLYTSMMNAENVIRGLEVLPKEYLAEILIHPRCDLNNSEYNLLFNENLKSFIKDNEIELTNYNGVVFDVTKNEKILV